MQGDCVSMSAGCAPTKKADLSCFLLSDGGFWGLQMGDSWSLAALALQVMSDCEY